MNILDQVLKANRTFVEQLPNEYVEYHNCPKNSKYPNRHLAIFTCMDTRLVNFLEVAMGIKRGEAKVIKNAGNTITGPFEATIRSLLVGIFELDIKEILVIGHLDCGVAKTTGQSLIQKMLARGISADAIKMVKKDLEEWIDNFHNPEENIIETVSQIRNNPLIPQDVPVHGLILDPHTGELKLLVDGYQYYVESIFSVS
ncbi:beta-class carbonic anhydrase [Pelosinus sp. sgz500959]|uniref:beta-class carbonic anhydrase n=1 Tax=Pelosinus sp. sgz500959 TaxID=3242472 RepID=UPI00366B144E